jgi:hypothetical protein
MLSIVFSIVKIIIAVLLFSLRPNGDIESLVISCMLILSAQIDLIERKVS